MAQQENANSGTGGGIFRDVNASVSDALKNTATLTSPATSGNVSSSFGDIVFGNSNKGDVPAANKMYILGGIAVASLVVLYLIKKRHI